MGWREIGKLAKTWLENEKTELLTTDHGRREMATGERIRAEREFSDAVGSELTYQVLERSLPPDLAARVTAARPENVRARRAAERLDRLAARPAATLRLTMSGELSGSVTTSAPVDITWPEAGDENPELVVDLELPEPVPAGSDTFAQLTLTVPQYRGPGRYDLARMWAQVEAGGLAEWDLVCTTLRVREESTDLDPCWAPGEGPGLIDVTPTSLTFDLAMVSAAGSSRVRGTVDWATAGAPRGEHW